MAATIKDVADFFKTGDKERDSLKGFTEEWKALNQEEKDFFLDEVGKVVGK